MPDEIIPPTEEIEEETQPAEGEEIAPKEDEEVVPPKEEDSFDEDNIDEDVKNYKPTEEIKGEEDEIDPEDEAKINKILEKRYGSDINNLKKQVAIDSYFNAHPEYSKYRGAAEKYVNHPTYSKIPIHNIVAIVSSKDQQKIGAAKERAAAKEVSTTKVPGASVRKTTTGSTDWKKVSKDEFEAQKAKVLGRMGN